MFKKGLLCVFADDEKDIISSCPIYNPKFSVSVRLFDISR